MRYSISFLLLLIVFLFSSQPVLAHLAGQPPYFKLNGKYSDLYPIQSMFPGIELPQDIAPENYLVGQEIRFELDLPTLKKVVPPDIVERTNFIWDFGDGSKTEGTEQTHVYKQMGSKMLKIFAEYTENGQKVGPTLIQSVLLQILPDKKYQLPKTIIKVNGKEENKDPRNNVFEWNLTYEVVFDASSSRAPSSKIASYLWSFTDGSSSKEPVVKHTFANTPDFVNPALRITDANGFFTDAYVGIKHNPKKAREIMVQQTTPINKTNYVLYTLLGLGVLFVVGVIIKLIKKKL